MNVCGVKLYPTMLFGSMLLSSDQGDHRLGVEIPIQSFSKSCAFLVSLRCLFSRALSDRVRGISVCLRLDFLTAGLLGRLFPPHTVHPLIVRWSTSSSHRHIWSSTTRCLSLRLTSLNNRFRLSSGISRRETFPSLPLMSPILFLLNKLSI